MNRDDQIQNDVTSESLLIQLRANESRAWSRFGKLYKPLVIGWCQRLGVDSSTSDDVLQEVMVSVGRKIDSFRNDSKGQSFRKWLYTITRNKVNDHFRSAAKRPDAVGGTGFWKCIEDTPDEEPAEWQGGDMSNQSIVRRAVELVKTEFEPKTFDAFWMSMIKGMPTSEVSEQLSMTGGAVRKARHRVIHRLRTELSGMIEELFDD